MDEQVHKAHRKSKEKKKHDGGNAFLHHTHVLR